MSKSANLGDIFAVLADNSADLVDVVNKIGLTNLIKCGPAIFRIMKTLGDRQDVEEQLSQVEKSLYYNEATRERVRAFQRAHHLNPDGLIGDRTWSKVEELLATK